MTETTAAEMSARSQAVQAPLLGGVGWMLLMLVHGMVRSASGASAGPRWIGR